MTTTTVVQQILDRVFVDSDRKDLFFKIGSCRSPFLDAQRWPYLEDEFAESSRHLLGEYGHDHWTEIGGINMTGQATLRPSSEAAEDVIRRLENDPGGFIWESNDGPVAVRLLRSRRKNQRFGLCIQLDVVDESLTTPPKIRLGNRGGQLLWLVHAEVMRSRQSMVTLPLPLIKEIIWGREHCPQNWRQDVQTLFRSLTQLRVDVLQLNRQGWQPRLGATSCLIDCVEFSWILGDVASPCDSTCRLWGVPGQHHHVRVGTGHSFLGVLSDHIEARSEVSDRSLTEPCRPLLNALIGRRDLGLSEHEKGVILGIVAEMTCGGRGDPILQEGNVTPFVTLPCPSLADDEKYVAFNGNGKRKGNGYRVLGKNDTGWVFKAGLPVLEQRQRSAKTLFDVLSQLSGKLGLIAAGYSHRQERWLSLPDLQALARGKRERPVLFELSLRIYAMQDFMDRLIELVDSASVDPADELDTRELNDGLAACGLTHGQIATELGVARPFVSSLLHGERRWPQQRREQAIALLARIESPRSTRGSSRQLTLDASDVTENS